MQDTIVTATAGGHALSVVLADTTGACRAALNIHQLTGAGADVFAEALTGGVLLGSTLKNPDDLVTMTIRGDGPLGGLTVTADSAGGVKGYVYNEDVETAPGEDVLGAGSFTVSKDIGLKEPYTGQMALVSENIGADLTAYFNESEQTASVCETAANSKDGILTRAGGFLIQLLPDAPEDVIAALARALETAPPVPELLALKTPEAMLKALLPGLDSEILEVRPVRFHCGCSRARVESALIALGARELESAAASGDTEVVCDFCKTAYTFTPEDLRALSREAQA